MRYREQRGTDAPVRTLWSRLGAASGVMRNGQVMLPVGLAGC